MKFFHTADIHFGVENYGKIDPVTGIHTRLLDFAKNLDLLVDQAIAENIDFVMFSGDAYKTANPTPTQQKMLAQRFLRLQQAGIPIVIIVGNHDHPLSFGKANALDVFSYLPVDGFYVFSRPGMHVIQTKSGPVQIIGIPWPTRNHVVTLQQHHHKNNTEIAAYLSESVGNIIAQLTAQLDPEIPAVLGGHLTVSSGIFSGSEKCAVYGTDAVFLPSQLAVAPLDYVALGHLHRFQDLNMGGIPVVYAGSIERVDFGERKEEKGFVSIEIARGSDGKRKTTYQFHVLPTRHMLQIDVPLDHLKDQTEQLLRAIEQHMLDDAIVKIVYHLPVGAQDRVDLSVVLRACQKAMYVVGVIPVHQIAPRERRAALKIDMDFTTLLNRYFETKNLSVEEKTALMDKAFMLQHELEAKTTEQES
ncbi:exonuclease subunit SbcD [Candidatus Dependentiae bacterium]|nr:exonuclease subunit SbcD [Candidatus Dependentiae bacterium]